jgi:RNA polymerase sigma-70 factor (ECF subfamily)
MISTRATLFMAETASAALDRAVPLNDAALRAGLERHHAESFGWALHCCGRRRDDAENVLQLAYLKVLSGKAVFEGRSSFKTWLFSVIRRTAAGERRADFLRHLRLSEISRDHRAATTLTASDSVERDEARDQLQAALQTLPARQRDILHLVF